MVSPSSAPLTESHGASGCVLHALGSDSPAALVDAGRQLLLEYGRFVASQPTVATFCYGALEQEAEELPQSYLLLGGGALLALLGDQPVGFIAWRSLPAPHLATAWELKRLWIRPQARGLNLGRTLVEEVIRRARLAGKSRLYLDTAPQSMAAAHRLYLGLGFEPCPAYNGRPAGGIAYMTKAL